MYSIELTNNTTLIIMITYYLIHTVKRTVLYQSNDLSLMRSYIDREIPVSLIPRVSVIIDDSTD